jgi:2,3-bisphosphoglycerate-dependent phosphoglycerate mutase
MAQVILVRHGQSTWNLENKFTGWVDIDLSKFGEEEALGAGKIIKNLEIKFDVAYASILLRSIHTLEIILKQIKQEKLIISKDWRLNERHYGGLQGLNKEDTSKSFGEEQVLQWRRSYSIRPPDMNEELFNSMRKDKLFNDIPEDKLPKSESLKDTTERLTPFIKNIFLRDISSDKNIIISAHGNSLRALIKYIENISDEDILKLEIPTGKPIIMKFKNGLYLSRKYL